VVLWMRPDGVSTLSGAEPERLAWAVASIAPKAMTAEISKARRLLREDGTADGSPGRVRSGSFMARAKRGFAVNCLRGPVRPLLETI
jgi:hypothetical protein